MHFGISAYRISISCLRSRRPPSTRCCYISRSLWRFNDCFTCVTVHDCTSKSPGSAGYPLSASLLRRKLVDGILNQVKSQYYKYAVSDLKIAHRYAVDVKNWEAFQNHEQYVGNLKSRQGRKNAFWHRVKDGS